MAGDGVAALDQARRGSYDALVLDDELPGLRGCDVLRALRREECRVGAVLVQRHIGAEPGKNFRRWA